MVYSPLVGFIIFEYRQNRAPAVDHVFPASIRVAGVLQTLAIDFEILVNANDLAVGLEMRVTGTIVLDTQPFFPRHARALVRCRRPEVHRSRRFRPRDPLAAVVAQSVELVVKALLQIKNTFTGNDTVAERFRQEFLSRAVDFLGLLETMLVDPIPERRLHEREVNVEAGDPVRLAAPVLHRPHPSGVEVAPYGLILRGYEYGRLRMSNGVVGRLTIGQGRGKSLVEVALLTVGDPGNGLLERLFGLARHLVELVPSLPALIGRERFRTAMKPAFAICALDPSRFCSLLRGQPWRIFGRRSLLRILAGQSVGNDLVVILGGRRR